MVRREPRLDGSTIRRPRLEQRLDESRSRRLTLVVADAGYGKTTLLRSWARDGPVGWHTFTSPERTLASATAAVRDALAAAGVFPGEPQLGLEHVSTEDDRSRFAAVASQLCAAVSEHLTTDVVLVLDDVQEIGARSPASRLLEALVRQAPPHLHLVVSSRAEPPFRIQRLRGQGEVAEIVAADLAFDLDEVRMFVEAELETNDGLAEELHELTGGWPAAIRLAVETLRADDTAARGAALDRLRHVEGPLIAYLAEEVFGTHSKFREFVTTVAPLDRFDVELCEALGLARSAATIAQLERRGFALPSELHYVLHGLVRTYGLELLADDPRRRSALLTRAIKRLEALGRFSEALSIALQKKDPTEVVRLLGSHEGELLNGSTDAILEAVASLPAEARDSVVEQIAGRAHFRRSEWDDAAACFERAAGETEHLPARLAWLMGRVELERGRLEAALAAFRRGRLDGASPAEEALLLGWSARAHWLAGDAEECRRLAERALVLATLSCDAEALAAAHSATAMTSLDEPQNADLHTRLALAAAERAGDVSTAIRTRLNRTHLLELREAIPEVESALHLAEIAGDDVNLAYALHRRGEVEYYLGRLDDAALDFERALALNDRIESTRACWNLMYLGDVWRERGDLARARAAYERSLGIARGAHDGQGLRGSQAGLALVLAHEEGARACDLAAAAVDVSRASGHDVAAALNAAGWVALVAECSEEAAAYAEESEHDARREQFAPSLAEAIELDAMAGPADERERRLADAAAVWTTIGNHVALARNELAVARLRGDRAAARRLTKRLRAAGVRETAAAAAGLLASLPPETPEPVAIRTLGGFAVLRDGVPVALSEWRSRKARDLLKLLVSRRGRPIPREALIETLWPGEEPSSTARRLSVALSMLRAVLDPGKRFAPDYFVRADDAAVALQRGNVAVDLEEFLADARAGLDGDDDRLRIAEESYAGDFLEEDAYEEWSIGPREESRASYIDVARTLASRARASGDFGGACRYLLRVLERDRYDEHAHLELVTLLDQSGRHGEARRCYRAYVARMAEIEIEPATYPAVSRS